MEENLNKLLIFQVKRNSLNLAKHALFLLEEQRDYALKLEKIIKELNIDNLDAAGDNYIKARKRILDISNSSVRELEDFVKELDIKLK